MSARRQALWCLLQVVDHGHSLNAVMPELAMRIADPRDKALSQELVYGVMRYHPRLNWIASQLLQKRFKPKDQDLAMIVEMALYQLFEMRVPDHAAVNAAVELAVWRDKEWAKGVINAVLRNAIRQREEIQANIQKKEVPLFSHPSWMLKFMKANWPQHWRDAAEAALERPPMSLRVNLSKTDRDNYLQRLADAEINAQAPSASLSALVLDKPIDVNLLPGFADGDVSIQDIAAQLATQFLDPQDGERILDACAAPGGKTGHILEHAPQCKLTAVELETKRIVRIGENLQRIGVSAEVIAADLRQKDDWWDEEAFDRILLDAPCSATGVMRRNPDIKTLRAPEDIAPLVELQGECLDAVWPTLKDGGTLLYATCSIFKAENEHQVQRFLERTKDAQLETLELAEAIDTGFGLQLLPGNKLNADGFFYAKLVKTSR